MSILWTLILLAQMGLGGHIASEQPDCTVIAKPVDGTWTGAVGTDGHAVAQDSAAYPPYVAVTMTGQSDYTWAASTDDPRAMQRSDGGGRIAATWYSATSFTIDLQFHDTATHRVSIYALDWDGATNSTYRSQTFDIANDAGPVDSQTISSFAGGQWLSWSLSGHATITVTNLPSSVNAVVEGIFFDPDCQIQISTSMTAGEGAGYQRIGNMLLLGHGVTVAFTPAATGFVDALVSPGGWINLQLRLDGLNCCDGQFPDLTPYMTLGPPGFCPWCSSVSMASNPAQSPGYRTWQITAGVLKEVAPAQ